MKRAWVWLAIVIVVGGFLWREYGQKSQVSDREMTPDYRVYENSRGRFSLMVPYGWQVEEATGEGKFVTRVAFRPTGEAVRVGNIGEMSVTVIASPSAEQEMSTQAEFDAWLRQPVRNATEGAVVKLANEVVAGQPAVRLAEMEPIPQEPGMKFWSVTTWMKQDGINYYINMMSNGTDFKSESGPFSWMLSKFSLLD